MSSKPTLSAVTFPVLLTALAACFCHAGAQLVQPVISEYKTKASGRIVLTNNTAEQMIVLLEPKSFSISAEGHGTFRALDPGIDVQLSATSVKLNPQESYYVFYKASAQSFPAWFTVYATFSPLHHGRELDVRIQLPHTVYLYQKQPLTKNEIEVSKAVYSEDRHQVVVELKNVGPSLGRVLAVKAAGPKGDPTIVSGFPMLPGLTRQVKLEWKEKSPPSSVRLEFEHFSLTPPITLEPPSVASAQTPPSSLPAPLPGAPTPATGTSLAVLPPANLQAKGLGTPQR